MKQNPWVFFALAASVMVRPTQAWYVGAAQDTRNNNYNYNNDYEYATPSNHEDVLNHLGFRTDRGGSLTFPSKEEKSLEKAESAYQEELRVKQLQQAYEMPSYLPEIVWNDYENLQPSHKNNHHRQQQQLSQRPAKVIDLDYRDDDDMPVQSQQTKAQKRGFVAGMMEWLQGKRPFQPTQSFARFNRVWNEVPANLVMDFECLFVDMKCHHYFPKGITHFLSCYSWVEVEPEHEWGCETSSTLTGIVPEPGCGCLVTGNPMRNVPAVLRKYYY